MKKIILTKLNFQFILWCICFFIICLTLFFDLKTQYSLTRLRTTTCIEKAIYDYIPRSILDTIQETYKRDKNIVYENRVKIFKERNYIYDHFKDSVLFFSNNEEWEYRTIFTEDTIVTKVVNKKIGISKQQLYNQTMMFLNRKVNIDSLATVFADLLYKENIKISKPVYVVARYPLTDSVYKNFENITDIKYNYVTPIYNTGHLDEIEYQAYLTISFGSLFGSMSKKHLYVLFFIFLLLSMSVTRLYIKDQLQKQKKDIKDLGQGVFEIGNVKFFSRERELIYNDRRIIINNKTADTLLLFIQYPKNRVSVDRLLEDYRNKGYLTTGIMRLRKDLKEVASSYNIVYYKQGYYQLEFINNHNYFVRVVKLVCESKFFKNIKSKISENIPES